MKILALDSSAVAASAALTEDDRLNAEFTAASAQKHSCTLLPMVQALLTAAGTQIYDIDAFAVNAGPGSFTGVRIGISLVKGLAFGSGKPVISVSTLEALAYNLIGFRGIICPVMDARRGQFYNALFRAGERLTPDRLLTADELTSELAAYDEDIYFTGDGSALAASLVSHPRIVPAPARLTVSNAYSTAVCAYMNYKSGTGIFTDETIKPVYLRLSQAERERKERLEKENG